MFINLSNIGFKELTELETQNFESQYRMTVESFMEKYGDSWIPDDLTEKYVIAVDTDGSRYEDDDKWKWCLNIQSIYTPREDQCAELMYCGHIAFITVYDLEDNIVTRFYKDDECYPYGFDEWFGEQIAWRITEEDTDQGDNPCKSQIIDLMKLLIKAHYQNQYLEVENIKEEDIIVCQGL